MAKRNMIGSHLVEIEILLTHKQLKLAPLCDWLDHILSSKQKYDYKVQTFKSIVVVKVTFNTRFSPTWVRVPKTPSRRSAKRAVDDFIPRGALRT